MAYTYLPDPRRAQSHSRVFLDVQDGHTVAEAQAALGTLVHGQTHRFRRVRRGDHLTVLFAGVTLPWLRVGCQMSGYPPNVRRDIAEIRRILGGTCTLLK